MKSVDDVFNNYTPVTETGCWLWDGYCKHEGYGYIVIHGKKWRAHRLAYTLANGDIPIRNYKTYTVD